MAAFARALRQMPAIIADNGGYDSAELVTQLRAKHAAGNSTYGLDMYNGKNVINKKDSSHWNCLDFSAFL